MTKSQTAMLKGVAIMMMLFLHLFNFPTIATKCHPFLFLNDVPIVYFVSRACNPVGIFLMLSGYGLSYLYARERLSLKGQLQRLLKLYIHYLCILLVFVVLGSYVLPEKYPGTISEFLMNMMGVSCSYNPVTWFLLPFMLLSLSSVLLFKYLDKIRLRYSLLIVWILFMFATFVYSRYVAPANAYDKWYTNIVIYFQFLLPFLIGAAFYRYFDRLNFYGRILRARQILLSAILLLLFILNCLFPSAAVAYIFQFSYIFLFLQLKMPLFVRRILQFLGRFSMAMWIIHAFFCYQLFPAFIYGFKYPLLIYIVLLVVSLLSAISIDFIVQRVLSLSSFLKKQY